MRSLDIANDINKINTYFIISLNYNDRIGNNICDQGHIIQ